MKSLLNKQYGEPIWKLNEKLPNIKLMSNGSYFKTWTTCLAFILIGNNSFDVILDNTSSKDIKWKFNPGKLQ